MQKNIFLFIFLLTPFILITNGQANIPNDNHWNINVAGPNGESLEIIIPKANPEDIEGASPNNFRNLAKQTLNSVSHGFNHTIHRFPMEAAGFYTALGAIAVYNCAIEVKNNPMACSEFGQELKNPISYFSFFLFMTTNHSVSHFLNTGGQSLIPRALIGYLGMAAGSFVSSLSHEFLVDPNIRYIVSHFFKSGKTSIEEERLSRAWQDGF